METNGTNEYFFHTCGCCLVCRKDCVDECGLARAFSCVIFLTQALQLAKKTLITNFERQSMERVVRHRIPGVLTCDPDQKQSFLCSRLKQGSIVEMCDAARPRNCLQSINSLNTLEIIWELKEKHCHSDKVLV